MHAAVALQDLAMDSPSPSFPPPHRAGKLTSATLKPHKKTSDSMGVAFFAAAFLLVVTIQSLAIYTTGTNPQRPHPPPPPPPPPPTSRPHLTFHPLRDPAVSPYRDPDRTWFMSTLSGRGGAGGMPEHFVLPSRKHSRVLCLNPREGTYALAGPDDALPAGMSVRRGLTFVADSYYDYENPWHALNAVSPFFAWMAQTGCRHTPARFVLFRNGEAPKRVGRCVRSLMEAALGGGASGGAVVVDDMGDDRGVVCFEKAVVFRRGLGAMAGERRRGLFEMVRCRAWEFCKVAADAGGDWGGGAVRVSLVARQGKRGFRNESGARAVVQRACGGFSPRCSFRLVRLENTSFCDQVNIMAETDVLVSTHGAQLTNMVFMPKGSSVMEMFPKGWLEGAGVGQFIYQWFASWSEMSYEGAWRDTHGLDCPGSPAHRAKCFHSHQKDQLVGLNETYLSQWVTEVINKKLSQMGATGHFGLPPPRNYTNMCLCSQH